MTLAAVKKATEQITDHAVKKLRFAKPQQPTAEHGFEASSQRQTYNKYSISTMCFRHSGSNFKPVN
jgi:hypothetical protein